MNKDGKEEKVRNRELAGGSVEVIGDQALCQCSNGSAQIPLKVTSQQKFYCNSASRLIATNGDKDGSSLNFGNCKARNNSPCMPLIQWKYFYDKILISDKLSPLTMRSEGMCLCGGTVSFVTSGQQVVVNPPRSAAEAKRIAHTNPLFKEEDMHRETGTRPQRDNAPVERRVPKASVTSVRVNGKVYISPREYDDRPLVFTTTLTSGVSDSVTVKWDVMRNGEDIATGLGTPPPRDLFRKAGEYKVFAYVNERGSKQGGGYVTVDVSTPKFESLAWKYANGEIADRVGKRCTVHAHLQFKGMGGVAAKARFCFWGGSGKQGLTDFMPLAIGEDGCATMELALTEEQLENIRGEQQAWNMKVLVRVEIVPNQWIEGYKRSIDYPIEYTDKEEIVSTMLYHDKDCKEKVNGFVECGHTVYARVITRGFEDGLLTLSVFCHGNVPNDNTAATGYVYKIMGEVDEDGVCILEINTDQSWLQGKHSEMFDMLVIGGYFREELNNTPLEKENYSTRNTCKMLQMGKDKGMLLLALPKQEIEEGQSKTMVQEMNSDGEKKNCICKKYDLIWGRMVDCSFRKKVVQVAKNLGLPQKGYKGANWLMAIMALETQKSFNPSKQNRFGYTGLIQLGEDAASRLGTTTSALKRMSAVNQLDYVEKYFSLKEFNGKLNTLTDLYLAVLYPTACGHGKEKDFIVLKNRAYKNNPLFFKEKDERDKDGKAKAKENGKTYVWEIEEVIYQLYKEGIKWKELQFKNCEETEQLKSQANRIEDVEIVFEKGVDSTTISESSIKLLKEMAKNSNNTKIHITSTVRTPRKQAQIMYSYIVSEGLQNQYTLYGPNGDKVIDAYVKNKKLNKSKDEIVNAMEAKIKELGPDNVSRHCGNHSKRNVFDISYNPTKLANAKSFLQQINLKVKDKSISKFIDEKKRNCYHIEIIQKK